jgi:hypothetical protein
VYYLDSNRIINEYCLHHGETTWSPGTIHELGIKASPNAGLAAICYREQIHVFYQGERRPLQYAIRLLKRLEEVDTSTLKELVQESPDDEWSTGRMNIKDALSGTNIAAVAYHFENLRQFHIFYQASDLTIKDQRCVEGKKGWFPGQSTSPAYSHPSDWARDSPKGASTLNLRQPKPLSAPSGFP